MGNEDTPQSSQTRELWITTRDETLKLWNLILCKTSSTPYVFKKSIKSKAIFIMSVLRIRKFSWTNEIFESFPNKPSIGCSVQLILYVNTYLHRSMPQNTYKCLIIVSFTTIEPFHPQIKLITIQITLYALPNLKLKIHCDWINNETRIFKTIIYLTRIIK